MRLIYVLCPVGVSSKKRFPTFPDFKNLVDLKYNFLKLCYIHTCNDISIPFPTVINWIILVLVTFMMLSLKYIPIHKFLRVVSKAHF